MWQKKLIMCRPFWSLFSPGSEVFTAPDSTTHKARAQFVSCQPSAAPKDPDKINQWH